MKLKNYDIKIKKIKNIELQKLYFGKDSNITGEYKVVKDNEKILEKIIKKGVKNDKKNKK